MKRSMGLISSLILGGLLYAGSGAMAQDMPGRSKPKALDVPKAKSSGSLKPDVEVHAGYEFGFIADTFQDWQVDDTVEVLAENKE